MSALTLKYVSPTDLYSNGALKVAPEAYNPAFLLPKTGLIEVKITSIALSYQGTPITGKGAIIIDIRAANFNEDCDNTILNEATINQDVSTYTFANDDGTYYFSVNGGVVGPSAMIDNDDSWNLLNVLVQMHPDCLIPVQVTVNYIVTFTDYTPVQLATPGA